MENLDIFIFFFLERIFWKDSGRVEYFVRVGNSLIRRSDRIFISFVLSFVKFIYCGLEMFDVEFEKFDEFFIKDK